MTNIETNTELFATMRRDSIRDTIEALPTAHRDVAHVDVLVTQLRRPMFWPDFVAAHTALLAGD